MQETQIYHIYYYSYWSYLNVAKWVYYFNKLAYQLGRLGNWFVSFIQDILYFFTDLGKSETVLVLGENVSATLALDRVDVLRKRAKVLAGAGLVCLGIAYGPSIYYWGAGVMGLNTNSQIIAETVASTSPSTVHKVSIYQPVKDSTLPEDNTLTIASAGILTAINEAPLSNYDEALKKGVWRVPNLGTPFDRKEPTILAAHRFGYLTWSIPYRLKNSFYNLPKSNVGDTVEINWNQRKYIYAIYKEEEGTKITDYTANLILYTCEDLDSDVRIFRYAKLVEN